MGTHLQVCSIGLLQAGRGLGMACLHSATAEKAALMGLISGFETVSHAQHALKPLSLRSPMDLSLIPAKKLVMQFIIP